MIKTERKGDWILLYTPEKWVGIVLEDLFKTVLFASKKQIHLYKMEKKVLINNKPANWNLPLQKEDVIKIHLFHPVPSTIIPTFMDIDILYEDDHLIIVNKKPFIDTHPNVAEDTATLLNGTAFHVLMNGEERQIKHIHRLDRDTSGCILFAKHELVGNMLDYMLRERKIKRTYIALAHGSFPAKKGTINKPIGRDRHHATRRRISQNGKNAITHYKVIAEQKKESLSLITCSLDTGRTHQIRVHLSSIGHPLAGDTLYGGKPIFNRQALHAAKIELIHPITEEKIECYAPFIDNPAIFSGFDIYSI
ncbi:RluA family pseudouridine synthase [Niallia nealsonii]|uniref:Pseudouridine synthase n=1 Tax=Niallia nealsonii TaxID=115979 RepID=A0A2N0Z798_9BACI|nr:RluA family pseudouridine synthase [Niallia nealsonii]PKG25392.1 RluA family pseudouridine synthase [Niallia nealsonii]